ncbi:hypothetical protein QTG54_000844 [Skeletonema marinoi]|uniref:Uncharacterized protein n=1 Tax=Skeletonema marinoi TaxID=267567 RepID=A0AAD9DKA7_9STRA|nr:hypothetical protein QTG54_000844 [Skeletonema marinoi]
MCIDLERDECCATDYDRHAMVLLLYRECLVKLGACMKKSDARRRAHIEEMGRIERRQDALVILSSIFDNYSSSERPVTTKCSSHSPKIHHYYHTVIHIELGLLIFLCVLCCNSQRLYTFAIIDPRLNKLISIGEITSIRGCCSSVAKKLASADDKADLAWWCSQQYSMGSSDQLKCLDLATQMLRSLLMKLNQWVTDLTRNALHWIEYNESILQEPACLTKS